MVQLQKTRSEFEGSVTLVVFPFVKAARKRPEDDERFEGPRDYRCRGLRRRARDVDHAQKVDALRACRAVAPVRGFLLCDVL